MIFSSVVFKPSDAIRMIEVISNASFRCFQKSLLIDELTSTVGLLQPLNHPITVVSHKKCYFVYYWNNVFFVTDQISVH